MNEELKGIVDEARDIALAALGPEVEKLCAAVAAGDMRAFLLADPHDLMAMAIFAKYGLDTMRRKAA